MKPIPTLSVTVLFAVVVLGAFASATQAASMGYCSVDVDWDSLRFFRGSQPVTVTWRDDIQLPRSQSYAYAINDSIPYPGEYDFESVDSWGDTSASITRDGVIAHGSTTSSTLHGDARAEADGVTLMMANGDGETNRFRHFTVPTIGMYKIELDYTATVNMSTQFTGERAMGGASYMYLLDNWDQTTGAHSGGWTGQSVVDGDTYSGTPSGTFASDALYFNANEHGSFVFILHAVAEAEAIPEPATLSLVAIGVLGMMVRRRRKSWKRTGRGRA